MLFFQESPDADHLKLQFLILTCLFRRNIYYWKTFLKDPASAPECTSCHLQILNASKCSLIQFDGIPILNGGASRYCWCKSFSLKSSPLAADRWTWGLQSCPPPLPVPCRTFLISTSLLDPRVPRFGIFHPFTFSDNTIWNAPASLQLTLVVSSQWVSYW